MTQHAGPNIFETSTLGTHIKIKVTERNTLVSYDSAVLGAGREYC